MSEFRHDYTRNYTIPLPSTSYLCPNKTDTAILSEGDGEKVVVNKRKIFSSSGFIYFCSLLLVNK
jgi:hypothetical protein